MLNDASGFRRIYLATGYTDLRRGMEGLASIIKFNFQLDPYQKDILFLFCGRLISANEIFRGLVSSAGSVITESSFDVEAAKASFLRILCQ